MRIREKDGEIILRNVPFKKWMSGFFLLLFFGFAAFSIFSDAIKYPRSTFEFQSSWFNIALNIAGFLFIAAVIIFLLHLAITDLLVPQITTRIVPGAQTVDVITRKLFFFKRIERYYFSQIKCFECIYPEPDETKLCLNVLTLVNGLQIDLESKGSKNNSTAEILKKLNARLKKAKIKPSKNKSKPRKTFKNKGKDES